MTKYVIAIVFLLSAVVSSHAQTCSAAYAKCEKNAMQYANNKADSIGWCAKSKAACMQTGVFPATKYTGRMGGLKKQ